MDPRVALSAALPLLGLAAAAAPPARAADAGADAATPSPEVRPGPALAYAPRPTIAGEVRACSFRLPLCVHRAPSVPSAAALAFLASAERAWDTLTGPLRLPAPDVSPDTLAYDVFLPGGEAPIDSTTRLEARDVRSPVDRARAFTVVTGDVHADCTLDALAARALARAILFRVAPATGEGTARAQTTYLSHLVAPCAVAFAAPEARAFQSRPERTVTDRHVGDDGALPAAWPSAPMTPEAERFTAGASLFWSRIDWAYGASPGAIVLASWALAPTTTAPGAPFWHDDPDPFDVLRVTFEGALSTGSDLGDLLLDTAIARAFMGSADDGQHQPETRALGDAALVPLDWDIPWPATPRRLAPRAPVFPTGASYVVVRRAGARPGSRLRVEIAWEEHALFRWALVKIDARGHELGRVAIPTRERATEVQMTLADLDGVDRVLLVGANAGDPTYAFDPNDEVWEPHAWLLTLAAE